LVGTLTSDLLALGDADGQARWIGIRRHQAVLVIAGLGLTGDWLVRAQKVPVELLGGVALLICALPVVDNLTLGEWLSVGFRYACRSRWTLVAASPEETSISLRARGHALVQGFELRHRGRLDLSGHDVERAQELAAFSDALATSDRSCHVSVHVASSRGGAQTLLALEEGAAPPEGWTTNRDLLLTMVGASPTKPSLWLLERWRYLRACDGLIRVVRIRDFSAVPDGRALLDRLQQSSDEVSVGLHFDVVSGSRSHRIAERAVHRTGTDGAASRTVGFRRTARADRALERLAQRETLVASGRALLRVAVYVSVRAPSQLALHQSVAEVVRRAHEGGLRCELGLGRQAIWFCHQLPGGPGW
jgi:hypothetical protein